MNSLQLAKAMRIDIVEMAHLSGGSHVACALSLTDIVAVLYADVLKYDVDIPEWKERDRFILSKGHAGSAVYSALAHCGFFSTSLLSTHYEDGSLLSGHISHKIAGVEFSTGSLGHGACVAQGMAKAAKMDHKDFNIYTIIGDGECDEGSIWEMALFSNHHKLNNFTVIIDRNNFQALGRCCDHMDLLDLKKKWDAFGWECIDVDGHNHKEIKMALLKNRCESPRVIIANTIKGKGVSFMENNIKWHYRDPQGAFYEQAMNELEENER